MNCPNCSGAMDPMKLKGHQGKGVEIDMCWQCHAFWFDRFESLHLAPASTLQLMKLIGERGGSAPATLSAEMKCPRCARKLLPTQDMQRNTRFNYFRCSNSPGHGRLTRFVEFLREKDFIRPLSAQQVAELREHIQIVNCSHCGAAIDLASSSGCPHCGSPVSMLDMKQPEQMLAQLRALAQPREIDPALPLALLKAKREVNASFGGVDIDDDWWQNAASSGLVQACLGSLARLLTKAGI
jgi:hypothetical protein